MGVSLAASAKNSGCRAFWASAGRSSATRDRAARHDLEDAGSLESLCRACQVVVSVCPPDAAEDVARQVIGAGFTGLYVDANAISPQRAIAIAGMMTAAGIRFVDGGIVGEPAWQPGTTWLHLSGDAADVVAQCFCAGPLHTTNLGSIVGDASALKMCFAAYTKGSVALLAAILATADRLGVRDALERQWNDRNPNFAEQAHGRVLNTTSKAWRFTGEMDEISATFRSAGMPGEFHTAAREIYRRLSGFKNAAPAPDLRAVLDALGSPDITSEQDQRFVETRR